MPYPSDVTDGQWRLIEPCIPKAKAGGRPRTVNLREVINAVLYLSRTGGAWRHFPPWGTMHFYDRKWRLDGTWRKIHDGLRAKVRRRAGK